MQSFSAETQNLYTAWAAHAIKKTLESLDGTYCISAADLDILKACAKNSSFVAEKVMESGSQAEVSTAYRVYARTQSLLRACKMLSYTRSEYWDKAYKANTKDEKFYQAQTHVDLTTHREYQTVAGGVSLVGGVSVDVETGEATSSTDILQGENLA